MNELAELEKDVQTLYNQTPSCGYVQIKNNGDDFDFVCFYY